MRGGKSVLVLCYMHTCTFNLSDNYFLCAFYLCVFIDRPSVRSLNRMHMHDMYHDQNQTRTNACAIARRVCSRPACMRKRNSTVRVRVNEFAIEFEEHLRIRWQKHNRAPLICLLNQLLNTNSRNASVSLCFQQNTLLRLASLLGIAFGRQHVTARVCLRQSLFPRLELAIASCTAPAHLHKAWLSSSPVSESHTKPVVRTVRSHDPSVPRPAGFLHSSI